MSPSDDEGPDPSMGPKRLDILITPATCTSSTTPTAIVQRRQPVFWEIRNACQVHDHTVKIIPKAGKDPLGACKREVTVPASGQRRLPCWIRSNANDDSYPYGVDVDGKLEDPELEVKGPLHPGTPEVM